MSQWISLYLGILEWVNMIDAFFLKFYLFIYLFMAALGLRCCAWAFSDCSWAEATLLCGAQASHYADFSSCGAGA